MGAEDVRNLQMQSGQGALRSASLAFPAFRRGQVVQRAVDRRDHADGNARIMRRRGELGVPEQCLDDSDVHAALQEMRREGMAQRVQGDRLGDAGRSRRLLEQPRNLSRRKMPATIAGEKHAIGSGHAPVVDGRAFGPPHAQQAQDIHGQHDIAILAALRLHDADDILFAVDVADLETDDLARAQTASVGQRQHHARLQPWRHGQDAPDLIAAQHKGHLDWLPEVEHLGRQVMPAQGDPEQKLDPGHRLVAGADTRPALDQMQLEVLHVIRCRSLRRSPEPGRKPFAGSQVAGLRRRPEIAGRHIRDHARAKGCRRCGMLNVHGKTLCQSRQNHLEQQHIPDLENREEKPLQRNDRHPGPLSRSDLVHAQKAPVANLP